MKKLYKSNKYKKYNLRHSIKQHESNKRYKKWKSKHPVDKNIIPTIDKVLNAGYNIVKVPEKFSFLINTKEVLMLKDKIKILLENRKKTYINLQQVKVIDNGAITMLLAIMTEFKRNNVKFNGNFPKDQSSKNLLITSGFFEHLYRDYSSNIFDEKSDFTYGKNNQIITKPGLKVIPEYASQICKNVTKTIDKYHHTSKGLYRMLIELMHNTNNHAGNDQGEEVWWLTVHHNKEKKTVSFIFLDFGVGIFNSLKNKKEHRASNIYQKLKDKILHGSDAQILKLILEGELHRTSTNQKNRGKGLHGIYEVSCRKQIKNLYIISNNVYSKVCDNEYNLMGYNFNGTFLYWEIDSESEVIKWKD
ncbi:MAG: hypothetical protein N4A63_13350 [Vallitalea sp.]|nr:hypothetical protein [Vallitalea sp.]